MSESKIWTTSDTHFSHGNIIKYCQRGFKSIYEMDQALINNWNSLVSPNDLVYHLGDFSFQSDRYRKHLNGKIILVCGNHDKRKYDYLFDEVVDLVEIKIGEFNCVMEHLPIFIDGKYKKGFEPDFTLLDKYDFIISGHVHEKYIVNGKNINVGVDVWNFKPIEISDLAKFLRKVKEEKITFM